jgi:5-methylthioadenosine/S-adenosylhomocysteine deaminase
MHVNETRFDNFSSRERFGCDTVPMLERAGLLGPDFLAVHCVHMNEDDIGRFVYHGVPVAYNAVSNMYLGSGIPPITAMEGAGLTIGIATDGSGSNNCQDMLETLKFSALLQKVAARHAGVVLAQKALDWATRGGAAAIGMSDRVGSLEPGKQADFFLLNPYTPKAVPVHDPIATWTRQPCWRRLKWRRSSWRSVPVPNGCSIAEPAGGQSSGLSNGIVERHVGVRTKRSLVTDQ